MKENGLEIWYVDRYLSTKFGIIICLTLSEKTGFIDG